MSKEIEEIFKEWLEEKPMANILVTKNSQMGYIIEFAEYYSKQKIEQLEKEVDECKEWTQTVVDRFNVANEENTKLKERVKELENILNPKIIKIEFCPLCNTENLNTYSNGNKCCSFC